MGTPVIRGFIPKDPKLIRLCHKAKLQRTLTGEISKEVADEIDAFFGSCDECAHQTRNKMYYSNLGNGMEMTACGLVGIKQHLILKLIIKVASVEYHERTKEIGCCTGYLKKPT